MTKMPPKLKKLPSSTSLAVIVLANNFYYFRNPSNVRIGTEIAYEHHISEEKEMEDNLDKGPKTKCRPWICLPSLLEVFSKDDLHRLYPDLFKVIRIVVTLPVTVASCERTYSKVKIINNYLRASMSPDTLEDLVQISSERDIANDIELSKLVEMFKLAKPRKLPL